MSGTYRQVLPRFVSVDKDGVEHELLSEYFPDPAAGLSKIFRKGYEWPFDCKKVLSGSSIIDLLVFKECALKGRRVYLDFRKNPYGLKDLPYEKLEKEAREYLENAHACFGTPLERLKFMNMPAYDLYLGKGVDLEKEMLEIALCAQHNNGGLDVDMWWQTNIKHLFACGEVAGTHGIYRPGGSALNAGQVGSMRAAQYISTHNDNEKTSGFDKEAEKAVKKHIAICRAIISEDDNTDALTAEHARKMSEAAGAIRNSELISSALEGEKEFVSGFANKVRAKAVNLWKAYRLRDASISRIVYMTAMNEYVKLGGKSRGSSIYTSKDGHSPEGMEDIFRFELDNGAFDSSVLCIDYQNGVSSFVRDVRPLPEGGGFFENVWREYRENKNIY